MMCGWLAIHEVPVSDPCVISDVGKVAVVRVGSFDEGMLGDVHLMLY